MLKEVHISLQEKSPGALTITQMGLGLSRHRSTSNRLALSPSRSNPQEEHDGMSSISATPRPTGV
jgi:hypothetical protein